MKLMLCGHSPGWPGLGFIAWMATCAPCALAAEYATDFGSQGRTVVRIDRAPGSNMDLATALEVSPIDGSSIIAGSVRFSSARPRDAVGIVRLLPDGSLDRAFGGIPPGVRVHDIASSSGNPTLDIHLVGRQADPEVQGPSRILLGITDTRSGATEVRAVLSNGNWDTSWGESGIAAISSAFGNAKVIMGQSQGWANAASFEGATLDPRDLTFAGSTADRTNLAALDKFGDRSTTFGSGEFVWGIPVRIGAGEHFGRERAVFCGHGAVQQGPGERVLVLATNDLGLADSGFGNFGRGQSLVEIVGPHGERHARCRAIGRDSQGRVYMAGFVTEAEASTAGAYFVARLTPTGQLDLGFATRGVRTGYFDVNKPSTLVAMQIATNASGEAEVFAAGNYLVATSADSAPSRSVILRLASSGEIASDFGPVGEFGVDFLPDVAGAASEVTAMALVGEHVFVAGSANANTESGADFAIAKIRITAVPLLSDGFEDAARR